MTTYTLEVTTPEEVPHDVLVEHLGYCLRELLVARDPNLTIKIVSTK